MVGKKHRACSGACTSVSASSQVARMIIAYMSLALSFRRQDNIYYPKLTLINLSSLLDEAKNKCNVLALNKKYAKPSLRVALILLCTALGPCRITFFHTAQARSRGTCTEHTHRWKINKTFLLSRSTSIWSSDHCALCYFFFMRQIIVEKNYTEVTLLSTRCLVLHLSHHTSLTDTENKDRIPNWEVQCFSL